VVAATNQNIEELVKTGRFREDLYFRLNVFHIEIPPLRDRKEDIPLLVEHFLRLYSESGELPPVPGQVLEALMRYDWPGNVRELQNAIQRYIAVKRLEFIPSSSSTRNDWEVQEASSVIERHRDVQLNRNVEEAERASIRKALELCNGRKGMAAKALGISRKTLFRKMKRLDMT